MDAAQVAGFGDGPDHHRARRSVKRIGGRGFRLTPLPPLTHVSVAECLVARPMIAEQVAHTKHASLSLHACGT